MSQPTDGVPRSGAALRQLVGEHCGFDPGELPRSSSLSGAGLVGLALVQVIAAVESTCGIELPADLITSLETVDDLLHYVEVKASQRTDELTR